MEDIIVKLHALERPGESILIKTNETWAILYAPNDYVGYQLFVTRELPIHENDWIVDNDTLYQASLHDCDDILPKVIATSDKTILESNPDILYLHPDLKHYFVEMKGLVEEITVVEMLACESCEISEEGNPARMIPCPRGGCEAEEKYKLNSDKSLFWKRTKKEMTREELKIKVLAAVEHGKSIMAYYQLNGYGTAPLTPEAWFEQNFPQ